MKPLPCPFCGKQPQSAPWLNYQHLVFCNEPRCRVKPQVLGGTARWAIKAWNTRAGRSVELP